ncbi:polysaccharide deacetylase family protein [Streptomyces nodosus]
MIPLVRRLVALGVLGTALAACGAPSTPTSSHFSARPSASLPASPSVSHPTPSRPATSGPPTLATGPRGLTPVFKNAATHEKVVALTFDADMTADQGPRAKAGEHFDNPGLIDALRQLKVPSTVFMTGRWAEQYPRQARAIGRDRLFEVANHSYSHHSFTGSCYGLPVLPEERMRSDVERAFTSLRAAGVPRPMPYFRFPGGCYDNKALRAISSLGVTAVQWDVVSGDAFAKDANAVVQQVLDGVRPGSVVVLHCTRSAAPVTEQVIRTVVPRLREQGYRFVKVSEMIEVSRRRS